MTFLLKAREGDVLAHMRPGGGELTLDMGIGKGTLTISTHDLLEALLGVEHLEPNDVDALIDLASLYTPALVERLGVFRANLSCCLRETDLGI